MYEVISPMKVYTQDVYNAAPEPGMLIETGITPDERFFVRSHGEPPAIDPARFRLVIDGAVKEPASLSLTDLGARFERVKLEAVLQCAGNRREELIRHQPIDPSELPWGITAVGNGMWEGYRLKDVLNNVGLMTEAKHIAFTGLEAVYKDGEDIGYGGSIPVDKACTPDVLLATHLNGAPLTADRGYPLRVVVGGYYGARSVKWLGRITAQAGPSLNYYQQRAYKLFPPDVTMESADWSQGEMLGQMLLTTAICAPIDNTDQRAGELNIAGYALSGSARVAKVEVSIDGGQTWQQADITYNGDRWGWQLWRRSVVLPAGEHELIARATDADGNVQPQSLNQVWNFKGYANNAWHRIRIRCH